MAARRLGTVLTNITGTSGQLLRVKIDESGFEFITPASLPSYTITNDSLDRVIDCSNSNIDELANILATLIKDLNGNIILVESYPDITDVTGKVTVGSAGGSSMHELVGYVRESSPTTTLNSAGSEALDCSIKSTYRKTGGTATVTLNNMAENQAITIVVESTGSAYTITWAGQTFRWSAATVPTPTPGASAFDVYMFIKVNGIVYGNALLNMK